MDKIEWTAGRVRLGDLIEWNDNPRRIKPKAGERLIESREEFGQVETLAVGPELQLYNGHQRRKKWIDAYGPDYMVDVRISSRPLTRQEQKKLTVYLNDTTRGIWDFSELVEMYDPSELEAYGLLDAAPAVNIEAEDLENIVEEPGKAEEPEEEITPPAAGIPDTLYPSNNEYGIPTLLTSHQADAFDLPIETWGAKGRSNSAGTYHFYTLDYRYERLWSRPDQLLAAGTINAVEPNFSVYDQAPAAVAIWQTYRKRWLARYWQSNGIRIFVDLNVARQYDAINLYGVPVGWKAYATRGTGNNLEALAAEHLIAKIHAGTEDILFLVYGGGKDVREWAGDNNAVWIAEDMDRAKGRYLDIPGG